ncbi:MAG: (Fe-S)-binding protein [Deltaproteobacteria bacterium]|nr:(Fe-S)-binding protein [Deltaproteobacteria bacterium]
MKLKHFARDLGRCTYCPKLCRFCCPASEAEHAETVTPWFKMSLAEMLRLGRIEPAGEPAETLYHCFACLHCRTHCRHGVDVPTALAAARALVLRAGGEPDSVRELLARMRASGNPWGEDLGSRLRDGLDARFQVPEAQAVVFAGCRSAREPSVQLEPLFDLLEAVDVDYVGLAVEVEVCCGMPLWQAGDLEGFTAHARKVAAVLSRARTVICPCPTCAYALGTLYGLHDVRISARVLTADAFLAGALADRNPARTLPGQYVFHDPCFQTRYLEQGDGPRQLLAAVLESPLVEPEPWSGDDASCCGGGGLVPYVLPEVAAQAARIRMGQLAATGAEKVASCCPGCAQQLGAVAGGLPVEDLIEILRRAYA